MKTFITICLLTFISQTVISQELIPMFSDHKVVPKSEYLEYPAYKSDNKVVFVTGTVTEGQRKNYLVTYQPNKELKRFEVQKSLKNAFGFSFFTLDNKIFRWYLAKHEKSKSVLKSIVEYDEEGQVVDVKSMGSFKYNRFEDQPTQILYYSPDSSMLLTVEVIDENHKKDPVSISLSVLDEQLNVSHKRTFRGKEKSQLSTEHCVARISNTGEAYLLQKVIPDGKEEKVVNNKLVPNYYYELIRVTADGKTKAFRIDGLKKFSNTQNLYITSDDRPMVITGSNESPSEGSPLIGLNCHVFNEETNSFDTKRISFASKTKRWGLTKDMDYKRLFNFFEINNEHLIDSSGIHMLLERNYFDQIGQGRKGSYTVNIKKTAIVLSISNEGKLTESMYVPKMHDSRVSANSTKLFKANDKLYLMYMTNNKNKNTEFTDLMFYEEARDYIKNNTVLCLATKEKGKIKKWNVKNSRDLLLYADLIHNNDKKIFLPIVDYSSPENANLGLMSLKIPN